MIAKDAILYALMTTLVVGATGGFGAGVVRELDRRGHPVRAFVRDPAKAARVLGPTRHTQLITGNVVDTPALLTAAEGCTTLVHAVNYPLHEWTPNMERATANIIAAARNAARREPVTLLLPGNVYGLGPQTDRPLTEDAPANPNSDKGRLRVKLENMLSDAATESRERVRVLIVRAGDHFGPTVRNSLVDRVFGHAVERKPMQVLGRLDVPHQWAFVPDLARAVAELLLRPHKLDSFAVLNFQGHVAKPQESFLRLIAERAGRGTLTIKTVPWWAVGLGGVFSPEMREIKELRYLFDSAVILNGSRLKKLLPELAETPLELAIDETIAAYRRDLAVGTG